MLEYLLVSDKSEQETFQSNVKLCSSYELCVLSSLTSFMSIELITFLLAESDDVVKSVNKWCASPLCCSVSPSVAYK